MKYYYYFEKDMNENKLTNHPLLFTSSDNIFEIKSISDFFSFLKLKRDFKVVGCLTNTIISSKDTAILLYNNQKQNINLPLQRIFEVEANVLLPALVNCLLSYNLDCTYLLWIPGTLWGAVVNNSGSWKLWRSILDNVEYIIYYNNKGERFRINKTDLIFWKRFSEFKCWNNIFIHKIWLKFPKKDKIILEKELNDRKIYRDKLFQDKCRYSLWSFCIKTPNEIIEDKCTDNIILKNNKISFNKNVSFNEISLFLEKFSGSYLSEKEIEIYDDSFKNKGKYSGYFVYDSLWRFLLQKRDSKKTIQNSWKIVTFWWALNDNENIFSWMQREIFEELWIIITDIDYCLFFLKQNKTIGRQTLCFIFVKKVEDIYEYTKDIKCYEWKIFIDNYSNFDNIMKDKRYSTIAKKVILYAKPTY